MTEAVCREPWGRSRIELRRSLENPHPESIELADQGLGEWASGLPDEDTESLVDITRGTPVRWVAGSGWV